jgi:Protein of unknown function (DUF4058)
VAAASFASRNGALIDRDDRRDAEREGTDLAAEGSRFDAEQATMTQERVSVPSPFPGMDPYLEHPDLWPDVHNRLIAALGDELSPTLRPRYYVALEERTYLEPGELALVGRPDLTVVRRSGPSEPGPESRRTPAVVEVELPMAEPVRETYPEVRSVPAGEVTVIELYHLRTSAPAPAARSTWKRGK